MGPIRGSPKDPFLPVHGEPALMLGERAKDVASHSPGGMRVAPIKVGQKLACPGCRSHDQRSLRPSRQCVLSLQLRNPNQYCYANSLLLAVLWSASSFGVLFYWGTGASYFWDPYV